MPHTIALNFEDGVIRATIVDVPTVRRHKLSQLSVSAQSYVIVEARLAGGVTGVGEAATLGGPRWSEESVEGIKAVIDAHLAPAVLGADARRLEAAAARMDAAARRNNAAKGAIESALFDAVGKALGLPAVQLLGGTVRERMPVWWTLASGDPAQEIDEAEAKLGQRLHDRFKVKIGAQPLADDLGRLARLAAALEGRATLIVDANQGWDEAMAVRAMPALAEMGVALVEQPLPAWNVEGLARVRARSAVPIMADECVFDAHDMARVAAAGAADTLSLKIVKHGGLLGTRIRRVCPDIIVQFSTGGRGRALDQRGAMLHLRPDMASLATGSCNFPTIVYENPPEFVRGLAGRMRALGVKPEIEVFDLAMLTNAADLVAEGLVAPKPHVQFVMGVKHALPARRDILAFEVAMLRELLPGATFTAACIGRHQMEVARWSLELGGHVRTGLEDNIRLDRSTLAPSNAALVRLAAELCEVHGRSVASPAEARLLLGLSPVAAPKAKVA